MDYILPLSLASLSMSMLVTRAKLLRLPQWSFGFGSNMNVEFVEHKKGHKVLDSVACVAQGWRMTFNLRGMPLVEPAFANATPGDRQDTVHGVAILLGPEDVQKLCNQERGYEKVWIKVHCYANNSQGFTTIKAFIFSKTKPGNRPFLTKDQQTPSRRYLNLLINGAKAAGLKDTYIQRLEQVECYEPTESTMALRRKLPLPKDLKLMTVNELAATRSSTDTKYTHVAIFGYILKLEKNQVWFRSHKGRDLTARFSRHFRGISMDENDDLGKPPFLSLDEMSDGEKEYIMRWLDFYLAKDPSIVGYVKEFLDECNFVPLQDDVVQVGSL